MLLELTLEAYENGNLNIADYNGTIKSLSDDLFLSSTTWCSKTVALSVLIDSSSTDNTEDLII